MDEVASKGPARVKHPECEAFFAFLFHNWRRVSDDHNTSSRKKIFKEAENMFDSLCKEKPKKPLNAFLLFSKNISKEVAANLREGGGTGNVFGDVSVEVSRRWKVMSIEEKQPFGEEAAELHRRYILEIKKYNNRV